MKTKKLILSIAVLLISGCVVLSSCKKKTKDPEPVAEDIEQESSLDNNLAENTMNDVEAMVAQVSDDGTLSTYRSNLHSTEGLSGLLAVSPCATISGIGTSTVSINFGTSGCLGTDGRTRTGILIFDFSTSTPSTAIHYRNPGFRLNISSQNYVVEYNWLLS